MPSIRETFSSIANGSQDIKFMNEVLKRYREVRKVHAYDYSEEDKAALQACATDLRPFTYSFLPAAALFWGLGKTVRNPGQLGVWKRTGLVTLRLVAAAEVFRLGYLVGSTKQCMDCGQRLVSLRSPLGGEIAAIMREQDPRHPLLRFERQPTELEEDGSRPRIASEANRVAKVAQLQQELARAKQGLPVDRVDAATDERLFQMVRHREAMLTELEYGGGAAAAAHSGSLEAARPRQHVSHASEYEAAAAGDSGAAAARSGGLVITDQQLPPQQQQGAAGPLASPLAATGSAAQGDVTASAATSSEDPLAWVLGSSGGLWGDEGSMDAAGRAAEEAASRQRRRERRARWWPRHGGGRVAEEPGH